MTASDNKQYNRDFIYTQPHKVLFHPEITLLQLRIYSIIRSFMDTTGDAYPSNNWIASQCCGVDRTSVIRAINKLVSFGFIQRIVIDGQRHLGIITNPMPISLLASDLNATPPSDLNATPPSDLNATQLDQNNITSKIINNIPVSSKTGTKKEVKDYEKDERFMRFYKAYPKKEDPRDAWKAFKSIIGDDDELLEEVINDIELRKLNHSKWKDRKYIKYPAVYLRKGEYLGEIYNEAKEIEEKEAVKKLENDKRLAAQEELSRKNAEYERRKQDNYSKDGKAYRAVAKKVGERPNGLKELRKQMGL